MLNAPDTECEFPWYAIYCVSGRELDIEKRLNREGIQAFAPSRDAKRRVKVARQNKFILTDVRLPVFSGYVFIKTDKFVRVRQTFGVLSLVKFDGVPLAVPDRVIDALKARVYRSDEAEVTGTTRLKIAAKVGDVFQFAANSPFSGLLGQVSSLSRSDSTGYLKAWVEILGSKREIRIPCSEMGKVVSPERAAAA